MVRMGKYLSLFLVVTLAISSLLMANTVLAQVGVIALSSDKEEVEASYYQITIENPKNGSVYSDQIFLPINFTVDYTYSGQWVTWRTLSSLFYSIDGKPAQNLMKVDYGYSTPIPYRNSTLIDISHLENGKHTLEIIAKFSVDVSNVYVTSYNRTSIPVYFIIDNQVNSTPVPTPTIPEFPIATSLIMVLAVVSLLLIFGKRKLTVGHMF